MAKHGPSDVDPDAYFDKALAIYGLDRSHVRTDRLETATSSVTQLQRGGGLESAAAPLVLTTGDFDVLNRWIGVPDRTFDDREAEVPLRPRSASPTPLPLAPPSGERP